ncbi:glycosyltransferase family 4 protein [Psychrobacter sp. N25K4-3-2]|uniref:glycosyltransferase family 4 protein n=1 Tax=Psychrobacter TaxID=497 RepID=UPI00188CA2C1|nr:MULTISPECIES: glycosyltransferase family 4 protein [Psychrobacter]MBF4489744.1 glycosyltransferase family 4 protein [Psychrobacter sp. N25K4-3-2]MCH1783776.1 glycosyltransferase family 4 protein [Psychrobacter glaciei]
MKIIYLHQYFNTPEMSGGTRSYEMAKRMVAAGHEVHMVTSYREEKKEYTNWFTTDESGIKVHWYPVPYSNHMSYIQRISAFFSFAFAAQKKSASLQGDVVFATSTPLTIALPAVFTARKLKVPMVFEVRDLWPEMPIAMGALKSSKMQFLAKKLESWAYQNSAAVIALSPGMKAGVIKTGYPEKQVAVIPNSSDNLVFVHDEEAVKKFRADRVWLGNKPLLIYAGTFGKVNGVDYIVKIAKELKKIDSNIRILLVGEGREKLDVIMEAKGAGVFEENVFFEPAMVKKDMPILFSAATMTSNLVTDMPEARANSANKFFDSLAASKPILLNHGGWMHEIVNSHNCGLAMWQQPIELVAEQLHEKMNNDEWLKQAAVLAKKLAVKEFDRDLLAEQLISVISSVVEKKSINASDIAPGIY